MIVLKIACVVEGFGDVDALPILLKRIVKSIDAELMLDASRAPIRIPRSKIEKPQVIEDAVNAAAKQIGGVGGILLLFDADKDCPKRLAPLLLKKAMEIRSDLPISVVFAYREYESWFLAAAESLRGKHGLCDTFEAPANIEEKRGAKEWLKKYMPPGSSYKETIHQPLFTREIDIELARQNSPSFDKLYRDLQAMTLQLQEKQSTLPGN